MIADNFVEVRRFADGWRWGMGSQSNDKEVPLDRYYNGPFRNSDSAAESARVTLPVIEYGVWVRPEEKELPVFPEPSPVVEPENTRPCVFCYKQMEPILSDKGWDSNQPWGGGEVHFIFSFGSVEFDRGMVCTKYSALICDDCASQYTDRMTEELVEAESVKPLPEKEMPEFNARLYEVILCSGIWNCGEPCYILSPSMPHLLKYIEANVPSDYRIVSVKEMADSFLTGLLGADPACFTRGNNE